MPKHFDVICNHSDEAYKAHVKPQTEPVPATTTTFKGQTLYAVNETGCGGCVGNNNSDVCRALPHCCTKDRSFKWMTEADMIAWTVRRLTEGEPHA